MGEDEGGWMPESSGADGTRIRRLGHPATFSASAAPYIPSNAFSSCGKWEDGGRQTVVEDSELADGAGGADGDEEEKETEEQTVLHLLSL